MQAEQTSLPRTYTLVVLKLLKDNRPLLNKNGSNLYIGCIEIEEKRKNKTDIVDSNLYIGCIEILKMVLQVT